MKVRDTWLVATILAVLLSLAIVLTAGAATVPPQRVNQPQQATGPVVRQISMSGTTTINPAPLGPDKVQSPEISPNQQPSSRVINRRLSPAFKGQAPAAPSTPLSLFPQAVVKSFDGLNHRDQRLANNGNQFSLEPPDQGLCAGNSFVFENINTALDVYDHSGKALLSAPMDLNTFYGYPAAINRTTGIFGPFVFDPSCYYDTDTQRWFALASTLDVTPTTGAFIGTSTIDLAVSQTSDPTKSWNIYHIPAEDDGTHSTPNHGCSLGPCFPDYPHIGADANGIYITTNEYSFFGPEFHGAQVYALSKSQLAAGALTVNMAQIDTAGMVNGNTPTDPGFTVWPAISPNGQYAMEEGGTEYFLSSDAASEANGPGSSTRLIVWALTESSTLSATVDISLTNAVLNVKQYSIPPSADQKPGRTPLRACYNTFNCLVTLLFPPGPAFSPIPEMPLDSNDTRMQQVSFAEGKLWGALDTGVDVGGDTQAGIEWFSVTPSLTGPQVGGTVSKHGYLATKGESMIYPAIAVGSNGRGVMAFTLVGSSFFPSAGYAVIGPSGPNGVNVAKNGLGPQDGFTEYEAFFPNIPRPRWGDYGAAQVDGKNVWFASEYIGQTCTLKQFLTNTSASPLASCKKTRTLLANWDTRISEVKP